MGDLVLVKGAVLERGEVPVHRGRRLREFGLDAGEFGSVLVADVAGSVERLLDGIVEEVVVGVGGQQRVEDGGVELFGGEAL